MPQLSPRKRKTHHERSAEPVETPREQFERAESVRILRFMAENTDLPHLCDLGAVIRSDNGRLRLWFEISEHTSLTTDRLHLGPLKQWKHRLVRFDGQRDPLPHPIPAILARMAQTGAMSDRKRNVLMAKEINMWIETRLNEWERARGRARTMISAELFGVLTVCGIATDDAEDLLNTAQARISAGTHAFPEHRSRDGCRIDRNEWPVRHEDLKSLARTWKKRQQPL